MRGGIFIGFKMDEVALDTDKTLSKTVFYDLEPSGDLDLLTRESFSSSCKGLKKQRREDNYKGGIILI